MDYGLMSSVFEDFTYGTQKDFPTKQSFALSIHVDINYESVEEFFGYWCNDPDCEEDETFDSHFHEDETKVQTQTNWKGWKVKG